MPKLDDNVRAALHTKATNEGSSRSLADEIPRLAIGSVSSNAGYCSTGLKRSFSVSAQCHARKSYKIISRYLTAPVEPCISPEAAAHDS